MPAVQLFFIVALIAWTSLGLVFFTWLWFDTLKRRIRDGKASAKAFGRKSVQAAKDSKPKIKAFGLVSLQASAMLAPFLIPIIVTAICLFFG